MAAAWKTLGLGLAAALALVAMPDAATARGAGGHGIHRVFPDTVAAGAGSPARVERSRACRLAWQASLTPERPSYVSYASFRKAHCAKGQTPHPVPPPGTTAALGADASAAGPALRTGANEGLPSSRPARASAAQKVARR